MVFSVNHINYKKVYQQEALHHLETLDNTPKVPTSNSNVNPTTTNDNHNIEMGIVLLLLLLTGVSSFIFSKYMLQHNESLMDMKKIKLRSNMLILN